MQISLVKHGNSQALVIPKAILDLFKIKPGSIFELKTTNNRISIESLSPKEETLKASANKILEKYNKNFASLANK